MSLPAIKPSTDRSLKTLSRADTLVQLGKSVKTRFFTHIAGQSLGSTALSDLMAHGRTSAVLESELLPKDAYLRDPILECLPLMTAFADANELITTTAPTGTGDATALGAAVSQAVRLATSLASVLPKVERAPPVDGVLQRYITTGRKLMEEAEELAGYKCSSSGDLPFVQSAHSHCRALSLIERHTRSMDEAVNQLSPWLQQGPKESTFERSTGLLTSLRNHVTSTKTKVVQSIDKYFGACHSDRAAEMVARERMYRETQVFPHDIGTSLYTIAGHGAGEWNREIHEQLSSLDSERSVLNGEVATNGCHVASDI